MLAICVILMSLCPWRRFGESITRLQNVWLVSSWSFNIVSAHRGPIQLLRFRHAEPAKLQFGCSTAEKRLLIQTSCQSRTKFRIDWFLITILFLTQSPQNTCLARQKHDVNSKFDSNAMLLSNLIPQFRSARQKHDVWTGPNTWSWTSSRRVVLFSDSSNMR